MQSRITGTTMPVLEFALEPNESIISEAGELSWMGNSIQMTTHTQFGGGGGLFGVLKRRGRRRLHLHDRISRHRRRRRTGFRHQASRHIVPRRSSAGHEYLIHRHGFLCGTPQIQIGLGFPAIAGCGNFPVAADSYSSASPDKAPSGSNSPATRHARSFSPAKLSAYIPATSARSKPACRSISPPSLASKI